MASDERKPVPMSYFRDEYVYEAKTPNERAARAATWDRALAARDREVAARALRDAAASARPDLANEVGGHTSTYSVRRWLTNRAYRIEKGDDRG